MNLEMLYIILTIVGVIFLGLSLFGLGELEFDLDSPDVDLSDAQSSDSSVGIFSLRSIATFILGFGMAGMICFYNNCTVSVQLLSGFGAGVLITILYLLIMKGFYAMQGDSSNSIKSYEGIIGIVTTPSTKSGLAQVSLINSSGGEYTVRELSGEYLYKGDMVIVVNSTSGTLIVQKQNNQ